MTKMRHWLAVTCAVVFMATFALAQTMTPGGGVSLATIISQISTTSGWTYDGTQTSAFGNGTSAINIQPGTPTVIRGAGGYIQMNNAGVGIEIYASGGILNLAAATAVRIGQLQGSSGNIVDSSTAPTISSGFGTSPSITTNNGAMAFRINVGTGGTANSGVIGLPASATGWNCDCENITTTSTTVARCKQTGAGTTTTVPIGNFNATPAAAAWVASDILIVKCRAL